LYGFVTTAESDVRTPRVGEGVSKPEPGVVVRVESRQKIRTDITDAKGRFVFDGLEAGDYRVSVFDEMGDELPRTAPQLVQVAANSCSSRVLLVPKRAAPK
jgi:hypothetical protein